MGASIIGKKFTGTTPCGTVDYTVPNVTLHYSNIGATNFNKVVLGSSYTNESLAVTPNAIIMCRTYTLYNLVTTNQNYTIE